MKRITLFALVLLFSFSSWSADLPKLAKVFTNTFWTVYQERYCGKNIETLSSIALEKKIDMRGAYIMEIRNSGFDTFGMVAALNSREAGALYTPERATPPFRQPGKSNWYFHVVLLADGMIHDYDFGNEAKPVPLKIYFEKMFIPTGRMSDITFKKKKIGKYTVSLYPAAEYLQAQNERRSVRDIAEVYETNLEAYNPSLF